MTAADASKPLRPGPLSGTRVVELASLGPGPFAALLLSDLGADVVRIERQTASPAAAAVTARRAPLIGNRPSIDVDLKRQEGVELILDAVGHADVLLEGLRPGVVERLGIGPDVCLARNPRLVFGRMTGWGQEGPLAARAGHDINYIGLAGALHAIGRSGQGPVPPLNLVGDFGGGGMLLVVGVLAALLERAVSGQGQVVDAAMVDGTALLMTSFYDLAAIGAWTAQRGSNLLDSGAPFYDVYETADGEHVAVGALEPQFFAQLVGTLGIDYDLAAQHDRSLWPELRAQLAATFRTRTRDQWEQVFTGQDACVSPVLSMDEAPLHPHSRARATYAGAPGGWQPAPAPRFSRSALAAREPRRDLADGAAMLRSWGCDPERLWPFGTAAR